MSPRKKRLTEKNGDKRQTTKKNSEKPSQISLDFIENDSALDLIEQTLSEIDSKLVEDEKDGTKIDSKNVKEDKKDEKEEILQKEEAKRVNEGQKTGETFEKITKKGFKKGSKKNRQLRVEKNNNNNGNSIDQLKTKDKIIQVENDINRLEKMPIRDIYKLARKYDVTNYTQKTKKELIFAVLKAQTESLGYFFYEGILEVSDSGYGFLRALDNNLLPSNNDVYVSQSQIRKFNLATGDAVAGQIRKPKEGEKYFALLRIEAINNKAPEYASERIDFQNLLPIFPLEQYKVETEPQHISCRLIDLFSPIGKGQRGLIVSPPKAGKTTILKEIANGIAKNYPETFRIILLIDERPEEVTDLKRTTDAYVIAAPFDMHPEKQIKVAEMAINMAKRLVEFEYDVVILLDSITRLARAYNLYVPPSGKLLSGGVDPSALYKPKHFFGAARNIEDGGSLTIISTALVETGSKMDEVIFEEFKGTGNMELVLSRQLANKRLFPAVNVMLSSTRKEELLLDKNVLKLVWILRRMISSTGEDDGLRLIVDKMKKTINNEEFLKLINKDNT
ncbi:MAG: transcription termination factor Rho [Kosmotogales bacterium]|nr:transcription termination factor Rho [Kosmotogales bacterium]